ncbi:MAG: molybdopterin-dependent oxidoreductase [Acidobacteria bacterium]|nr:molybdopterin-dependent oxidoreductase [Acidobacteriota bacterium]
MSPRHTHSVRTACPLDCPDSCSMTATIEDGRLSKLDGSHEHPVTHGFICAKVRQFASRVYGRDRLLRPGIRTGPKGAGQFRWVEWDEALEHVAQKMIEARDRHGAESVLPFYYGGSNGLVTQDTTDMRLFRRFGASRLDRTVCASTTGAANQALYGKMPSVTYADYAHARLIVVWGANPSASAIHLVPHIREAQRNGAGLVVIDPRNTQLARLSDLHLPVRPGTDVAVALALHRYLFEGGLADTAFLDEHATGVDRLRERAAPWTLQRAAEVAGVPANDLRRFAAMYAESSPALIRCGWGLERNRNGGNAAMAILALPAVAGKFGVRGGGYSMSNSGSWGLTNTWIGADAPSTRVINMNHLGRVLTDSPQPPVTVLFVYNCNPLATMPDQNRVRRGLLRDDLTTVVFDQVMTDSAMYADVVLPATTFLEAYDLARAYGPINLQMTQPVIDAVGDARPNVEVFADLEQRLGLSQEGDPVTDVEMMMKILDELPESISGALKHQGQPVPPCGFAPVQFVDVFPRTPDARIDLFPERLDREAPLGLYAYQDDPVTDPFPLAMISPSTEKTISSTLGELNDRPAELSLHPEDARHREIADGDRIRVFNALGEVRCLVSVSPIVRPGTVSLPKGLWSRSTENGSTANALSPDTLSDIGGGACFNDARVQVEKLGEM